MAPATATTPHRRMSPLTCDYCGGGDLRPYDVEEVASFWRCDECGLMQKGAMAPRHILPLHEINTEMTRDEQVAHDIRLSRIAMVVTTPRPNLLDIACDNSPTLSRATDLGWRASAVLENPRAVAAYRRSGLTAFHATPARLPFPTDFFDVVTAWFTLESVADVRVTLREWQRVLRPGGLLVLESHRTSALEKLSQSDSVSTAETPRMRYGFTPEILRGLAENEEFEILPGPGMGRLELLSLKSAATSAWHHVRAILRTVSGTSPSFQLYCRRPTRLSHSLARRRAA